MIYLLVKEDGMFDTIIRYGLHSQQKSKLRGCMETCCQKKVLKALVGEEGKIGYIGFGEWAHQRYCGVGDTWVEFIEFEEAIQKWST